MEFVYEDTLPAGPGDVPYRLLTTEGVRSIRAAGRRFLEVDDKAIRLLTAEAMRDMAHLLRPGHLQQLRNILDDPEASANDRFVATELLRNANIAAGGVLPGCQDTGTAIIKAQKGQFVLTSGDDRAAISRGVFDTYRTSNLRYSQLAPLDMFSEQNTGDNLPAEIAIEAVAGDEYKFLFIAKGGGSANKSFLYQQTQSGAEPRSQPARLHRHQDPHHRHGCVPALPLGHRGRRHFSAEHSTQASPSSRQPATSISLPTEGNERVGRGFPRH